MDVTLFSVSGEAQGKVEWPAALLSQEGSRRILQEVLTALRANQRRGTSDTKTRAEVSGGGHKPWRQKGTGNARSGSNRSPLWRKGGITFGPHPRSYRVEIDARKKRAALATALKEKVNGQDVSVVESFPENEGKTSVLGKFFIKAAPSGRVLVVVDKKSDLLKRTLSNLPRVSLMDVRELNPWAVMHAHKIFLTKPALQALEGRCPQG